MPTETEGARPRVVIAGGGVAGLEALLALEDLAGDRVDKLLVTPEPDFVYRPLLVEEPFGLAPAERHELEPLAREKNARLVQGSLASVDPAAHSIRLDDGTEHGYEYLAVCVGARLRSAFDADGVITFPGPEPLDVGEILGKAAAGRHRRIAFVVPPGVTWALPIYELALMTERSARERGDEVGIVVVTPEAAPLAVFGAQASGEVAGMLKARGIEVEAESWVRSVADGSPVIPARERVVDADVTVALAGMDGPAIQGLPADDRGFIPVDEHCHVRGVDDVWAAGDGTSFPLKQGGIGTQQADAAAEEIASRAGAPVRPEPFRPVLRGKLLTGDESLHMRHEVSGGAGEGEASPDSLWWPPQKIGGRYLSSWLTHAGPGEMEPPRRALDVEVALPTEWHEQPMTPGEPASPD